MRIYNDYTAKVRNAMALMQGDLIEHFDGKPDIAKAHAADPLPSLKDLIDAVGGSLSFSQPLGKHPDFAYLDGRADTEKHYIVSMFIDVKGSTNLFKKYPPDVVFSIICTIQYAALHTCGILGGYIQRLHGDGLFVYFGGKGQSEKEATERALTAASLFSQYVKTDLRQVFEENGVEPLATRIGIDFGQAMDTVWGKAGLGAASEITTCSLHTSLASKMQGNAISNGIVVGDNIVTVGGLNPDLVTSCAARDKERYVFEDRENGFRYSQYDLHWVKFLKQTPWIVTMDGDVLEVKPKEPQRNPGFMQPAAATNKPFMGN